MQLLNKTGLGSTSLLVDKSCIALGIVTQGEADELIKIFKYGLSSSIIDPSSLGRIRIYTIVPIPTAAAIMRTYGRSGVSLAWLRAFSQPIPRIWELQEQADIDEANNEFSYSLQEQLQTEGDFEAEDMSFADELTLMAPFVATIDDETRLTVYALSPVPVSLKRQLDEYMLYRTKTFAGHRTGGAVLSISVDHDIACALRFLGYLTKLGRIQTMHL